MARSVQTETITSLREYMERIETAMAAGVPLWFRGAGRTSHTLTPSLFRHPNISKTDDLLLLEKRILQRFRERSIPYQPPPQGRDEEWELLFLMQHFGVPTRLLDWTENPYIGLFFALTSADIDHKSGAADEPAAVWVLQPEAWNKAAFRDISYDGAILSTTDEPLKTFRPSADTTFMRNHPAAMFGLHNSPRIVAQRGVFTIFGKETVAMESVAVKTGFARDCLLKLEFPADQIGALRESLSRIGITDSVIFPDLAGLASELKRFYGYPV